MGQVLGRCATTMALALLVPTVHGALPRGTAPEAQGGSGAKQESMGAMLNLEADPRDPHSQGFEPRPGPEEGGDIWAFGRAHATVHHVLERTRRGNAREVADVLDAFSAEHGIPFGLGAGSARALELAARAAVGMEANTDIGGPFLPASGGPGAQAKGLNVLVLGAGLGTRTLRCLPTLLAAVNPDAPHELVSIEDDAHLMDGSSQLLSHAIGIEGSTSPVRHLPLMPGEGTVFSDLLETLQDGYGLTAFDLVLLEGSDRAKHVEQLDTLLQRDALRRGSVVHAEGPDQSHEGTQEFLTYLQKSNRASFDQKLHEVGDGASAVVATLRDYRGNEL